MIGLLLAALLQSAAPAAAAPATPATPPAKSMKGDDKPRTVCRKETVVGSTIKKKVCPRRVEARDEVDDVEKAEATEAAAQAPTAPR